ncbi:MAG: sulfate ABC transporter substrate-binding protein [Actinobacteria bacterium]|nr:MAG: sulfate ABC transporter substrate-binding protein [Actinomycetota bacterium]
MRRLMLALVPLAALVAAGCGGASDSSSDATAAKPAGGGTQTLSLVAYSTPQVVYDEVIPAFQKTAAGNGVAFKTSYGPSGDQSRAVESGLPADVVTFSLEPDLDRLIKSGQVAKTAADRWVTTSVVTFIVRKGNPKHIRTWDDLLKPGVQVVTPNPFTSGAAKWNLLAAYGAKGLGYVRTLLTQHVKVQPKSGREALQTFTEGQGDVLLSYENEAITAQKKGQDVDYVIPDQTIKIENPIAVTSKAPAAAKAFLDYALSKPAQRVFASWGYRPVDPSVLAANTSKFPTPSGLFTIAKVGGWSKVNDQLFDPDKGSVAKIEEQAGVSTAK